MADDDKTQLDTADIMRILQLLPHRYPFLLVDRIQEISGDDSCVGIKNVTINEPHFQGHFPAQPIMPGVLIVEGMAQTAGALCVNHLGLNGSGKIVYFMSIDSAHFRKPVVPGDVLEYRVRKLRRRGTVWKFACEGYVEGAKVADADLTAMIVDA